VCRFLSGKDLPAKRRSQEHGHTEERSLMKEAGKFTRAAKEGGQHRTATHYKYSRRGGGRHACAL